MLTDEIKRRIEGATETMRRRARRYYKGQDAKHWIDEWVDSGDEQHRLKAIAALNASEPSS